MVKKFELDHFDPLQLVLMQKHIEMGRDHLKSLISEEGLEILCSIEALKPETKKKIESSPFELAGTFTATLNSILTTTLGAWMGLNGFMGLTLNSKALFQGVIAFSATVGALIGILNFQFTKKEIQRRLQDRKLQDIQLQILEFLNASRQKEIDTFNQALQNRKANQPPMKNGMSKIAPILQPLIQTPLPRTKKKKSWLTMNWRSILVSSIPLMYGTFSSLSGYFNNAQKIAQQVGWENLHSFLTDPRMRIMELAFVIGTTIYFTIAFISTNRKKFYRDREIEKANELITKSQATLSELDDRLLKLKETALSFHQTEK